MTESNLSTLEPMDTSLSDAPASEQQGPTVEIQVEKIDRRQRQIQAKIQLPYTLEQVWQVLTDYESLSDFIPNLEVSQRLEHPNGGIRLEQVGSQSALMLKFCARVVLDMEECFPERISFEMVEGDFKGFQGDWSLSPIGPDASNMSTELCYTISVWPKRTMPILAVEQRLSKDLPKNLQAIYQRLDHVFGAVA